MTAFLEQFRAAPPGTLYGLYGDRSVFRLSLMAAGQALVHGIPVTLVDGSNRFDLYGLAEFARRAAEGRCTPDDVLRNIFISRAFTCYQMEAVITERLPAFVRMKQSPVVLIFGLLDTFYDEQAPLRDVRSGVQRVLEALQSLKREGVSILVASTDIGPVPPARRGFLPGVMRGMDRTFRVGAGGFSEELRKHALFSRRSHGTHSTHLYNGAAAGDEQLVEVPAGVTSGRSGGPR